MSPSPVIHGTVFTQTTQRHRRAPPAPAPRAARRTGRRRASCLSDGRRSDRGVGHQEAHPPDVEGLRDRPVGGRRRAAAGSAARRWRSRRARHRASVTGVGVVAAVVVVVPRRRRAACGDRRAPGAPATARDRAAAEAARSAARSAGRPGDVVVVQVAHVDEHVRVERGDGSEDAGCSTRATSAPAACRRAHEREGRHEAERPRPNVRKRASVPAPARKPAKYSLVGTGPSSVVFDRRRAAVAGRRRRRRGPSTERGVGRARAAG